VIKLFKFLKVLAQSKIDFMLPEKLDLLLYDFDGNNIALKIFKSKKYGIFHARKERFNLPILIKCFLNNPLKIDFLSYADAYIKYVKPKILITFNDNNLGFYRVNKKNLISIAVQRGNRSYHNDFLKDLKTKKKKYHINYYFVFNKSYSDHVKKYIKAKYTLLGSPLSNIQKIKKSKKNGICYISTFSIHTFNAAKEDKTFYKKYYSREMDFVKELYLFATSMKTNLHILGKFKTNENQIIEENFYKKINNKIIFKKNSKTRNTFNIINKYSLSVGISSSLNLEILGRKNKIFFFLSRLKKYPFITKKFGYFAGLKSEGPFWSSSNNYNFIIRKIKKIYEMSNFEWNRIQLRFNDNCGCHYNYKNTKLKKLISKIIIQ